MRPPSPWWILAVVLSGLRAEARTPPHIVIIVIDDLGWYPVCHGKYDWPLLAAGKALHDNRMKYVHGKNGHLSRHYSRHNHTL